MFNNFNLSDDDVIEIMVEYRNLISKYSRINGIENAGIFSIAYATATILYTIALYSGRLCQVTDIENKIKDKDYILNRLITCFIMLLGATFFLVLKRYTAFKTGVFALLAIFKGLEAFSDILYGIMQKNDLLYKSGQSLTAKGIIGLIFFIIVDKLTGNLIFACLSLVIVNVIILIVYDFIIVTSRLIEKSNLNVKNSLNILKSEFFVFVNSFAGIYILNASKYAIDSYLTENIQAIYGYIMMPATVMTLFTQFIVMPFLNKLKELYGKRDFQTFRKLTFRIKLAVIVFGVFAVTCAFLLGPEVLGLIYGVSLLNYRMNLCIIIGSYIFYAISYINLIILTTIRHTFVQFIIYIISMIIAFIVSHILVKNYEINGATFATSITLGIQFLLYTVVTKFIIYKEEKNINEVKLEN